MTRLPAVLQRCTCLRMFLDTPAIYVENEELRAALRKLVEAIDANDRPYPMERARAALRAALPASSPPTFE